MGEPQRVQNSPWPAFPQWCVCPGHSSFPTNKKKNALLKRLIQYRLPYSFIHSFKRHLLSSGYTMLLDWVCVYSPYRMCRRPTGRVIMFLQWKITRNWVSRATDTSSIQVPTKVACCSLKMKPPEAPGGEQKEPYDHLISKCWCPRSHVNLMGSLVLQESVWILVIIFIV